MFWLIGTAFALRNLLTVTTLGGFTRVFRENRDLLVFGGVWALAEILGPNWQKTFDLKKSKKLKILFFVAVSKNVFASKTERFSRLFSFSALGAPF